MGGHSKSVDLTDANVRLPEGSVWRKVPMIGAVLAVIGIGGTIALAGDHGEGYFAYLTSYLYFLSIALGALFFSMIFFLTRSSWSVTVRRITESFMITLPAFALLFIPVALGAKHIFEWMTPEQIDPFYMPLYETKAPYLNTGFFYGRAALYFVIWTGLSWLFWSSSRKQDESGDPGITRRLQALAAPGIALGALSLTFAAFDWNMSIDWHWFSTIYGVIYFAGGFMACFALLVVVALQLKGEGIFKGIIETEQLHGAGKMMFGMMCFWAYVSFSQLILIWYANIPEETLWYAHRMEGSWTYVSILLGVGHFGLPFFFLMSKHIKRNPKTLLIGAVWLLAMHYVDIYWMIMPNVYHEGAHFGLVEILSFVGVGGAFLALVGLAMQRGKLVAVKDPRLPESLAFEN